MEKQASQNIQDAFLNTLRREKAVVTIHLLHGATHTGRLKSFDKFSVLLDASGQEFLIFKHAIATVTHTMPRRAEGGQPQSSGSSGGSGEYRSPRPDQRPNFPPREDG